MAAVCTLPPHGPFVPQDLKRRRGDAKNGEMPASKRPAHAFFVSPGRATRWQTVQGGRLWMLNVKRRRNRAGVAVRSYLAESPRSRSSGDHMTEVPWDSKPARSKPAENPGEQAATFKAELQDSLSRLRSQIKEESDAQLSEASTESAMGEIGTDQCSNVSSADAPASPLEEICESVWDAVTSKASGVEDNSSVGSNSSELSAVKPRRKTAKSGCVAIDCEMVGVGKCKSRSILARVAVVDEHGTCLLDNYVRATERVTDYRTRWSGIRARDLVGAPNFATVRQRVAQLIRGKILVGHAIHNDLRVLDIPHPPALIRDTSFFPGLRRALAAVSDRYDASQSPSLKNLCQHVLNLKIQTGEHCPVEDAASTMQLYVRYRGDWEAGLLFTSPVH